MLYGDSEFSSQLKEVIRKGDRHKNYQACVDHAKDMAVHIYGEKPDEILMRARPREEEAIREYRINNFQPVTKAPTNKAITILNKIFNPTLYSEVYPNNEKASILRGYVKEDFPGYNSVLSFMREVAVKKMLADPNGIMCVRPQTTKIPQSKRLKPIIKVFGSSAIVSEDHEHFLVLVEVREEKFKTFYFEYYDENKWIYFKAWFNKSVVNYEELDRYNHNFGTRTGQFNAWKLRGISENTDEGEVVFKSFFEPARAYLNLSVIHESDVFGAYAQHMHPIRWETAETCDFIWNKQRCKAGKIMSPDGVEEVCPSCKGSGTKPVNSPYGAYKVPQDKMRGTDGSQFVPVGFVTVPTEATNLLDQRAERMQEKALWALNMDVVDEIGADQSGIAKTIDRSELFDFLLSVSETVYDIHYVNAIYFIALIMFDQDASVDDILPVVSKPVVFDIASVSEMINNYKAVKDSGLDRNYLLVKQMEILNKEYNNNPEMKSAMNAVLSLDPLPGYTPDEIDMMVSKRFATQSDAVIHFYIRQFIDRAVLENPKFFDLKKEAQMEKLREYAEEKIEESELTLSEEDHNKIPPAEE